MASASSFIEFSRTDQKERLTETVDSVTRSVSCLDISNSSTAISIFQRHSDILCEALSHDVMTDLPQLLYSRGLIDEASLDKIVEGHNSRITTLITSLQETVSSDYRKLKDIATTLSSVKETRDVAKRMLKQYNKMEIPKEGLTVQQEAKDGNEDIACIILRKNYSLLHQSIVAPAHIASVLHAEKILSDKSLSTVIDKSSIIDSRAVLLKAVREAVRSNYKHLELFVIVLRKFPETAHIGDTILQEYKKYFHDNIVEESYKDLMSEESSTSEGATISERVLFPRALKADFSSQRIKFGSTFFKIRRILSRNPKLDLKALKELVTDLFPDLQHQLSDDMTIDTVLDVLKRKCSIIDVYPLEVLVTELNIPEAERIIRAYKEGVKSFRNDVSVSLCLDKFLHSSPRFPCKTIAFVIGWDPDSLLLQDIQVVLRDMDLLNDYHIHLTSLNYHQ